MSYLLESLKNGPLSWKIENLRYRLLFLRMDRHNLYKNILNFLLITFIKLIPLLVILILFYIIRKNKYNKMINKSVSNLSDDDIPYKAHYIKAIKFTKCYNLVDLFSFERDFKEYFNRHLQSLNTDKNISNDPLGILTNSEYKYYLKTVRNHVIYKKVYIYGIIFWMLSTFLIPGTIGILMCKEVGFIDNLVYFISSICLFTYLTNGLCLIPSFVIGAAIHPFILKRILFKKCTPYNEEMIRLLGFKHDEKANIKSITAGSFISRF